MFENTNQHIFVRQKTSGDAEWVESLLMDHWGSSKIITREHIYLADKLPGFIAIKDEKRVGLITYNIIDHNCEIITLDSLQEGIGIGTTLIEAVKTAALAKQCLRLWLITTNDNLHALRFYQNRGFRISAVYPNAVGQSRLIKPEIPQTGYDGIPIRDEIELIIDL